MVRDLVVAIGRIGQATESYVTREELVAALDRVLGGLREEIRWGTPHWVSCKQNVLGAKMTLIIRHNCFLLCCPGQRHRPSD